ncbi:DUF6542 domain-containing protein [Umezawaea sp. Da 62-37]|uniref:DUF6542 domain-containing protein n=1 Tax=Umezawaea sp. Da 62-37 TaxID=3075927 RepID=UPI0028F7467C|nr:DUF6542 domain-containing protein [Umezawaea sp. Da 62-37]WNV82363.1 hypothetical protein RM788_29650 [Umezawaea sp. Da 62-37]
MTVTRERLDELDDDEDYSDEVAWNDRALFGNFKGLPWWAAVLIAFVLAIIGTYIDVSSSKTVGTVFAILFFLGCGGAIVFVERRSMFGPIVQPPLILAIVVPLVVVVSEGMPSGGLSGMALTLGKPLINGFPTMAITTIFTVVVGVLRVTRQRDPNRVTREEAREVKADRRADRDDRADRPSRPVAKPKPPVEKARAERPRERDRDADSASRRKPAPAEAKRPAPATDEDRRSRPRPAQQGERRRSTPPADRAAAPRQRPEPRDRPAPPRRPRPRDDD